MQNILLSFCDYMGMHRLKQRAQLYISYVWMQGVLPNLMCWKGKTGILENIYQITVYLYAFVDNTVATLQTIAVAYFRQWSALFF